MSVLLLAAAKAFVRAQFTAKEVQDVRYYGGEFSSDEVAQSSYKTPTIMLATLGWSRPRGRERMIGRGTRVVHMAAFVVTGATDREQRMLDAQRLAERLDLALTMWTPTNAPGAPVEMTAAEDEIRCENVYNRKIDAKGQALWLVSWRQCIKPVIPLPQLYDLLGVDIISTNVLPYIAQADVPEAEVVVTHDIKFQPE